MQRSSNIRVRLLFEDCTPLRPGSVGRRKCWFLLNIDACRRVTDVEYCIQKTFCLGSSSQIELLLDDFVLPPFEKSEIIQENDLIRVRLVCEGDQNQKVQVEKQHSTEAKNPSKRLKANTKAAGPSEGSKDDAPCTSTVKRKKTRKERKMVDNEKRDVRLTNDKKGSQKGIEFGQKSRLDGSVQKVPPLVENGTPKHSAWAHKHANKSAEARALDSASTSSASSSEDDKQKSEVAKSKRLRKIAGRRKVQQSKSVKPSSGTLPTTSSTKNGKCNGSGPLHSDSESSSTEEEANAIKRKQCVKVPRSGLPSKNPMVSGSVKTKSPVDTSTSSSASSMSSASSSSDSDGNPSLQLKQKQMTKSSVKPATSVPTKRTELPTPPVEEKAPSSQKNAVVKKSKSKSSFGHVRFSSDSDSSESEAAVDPEPSASLRSPSSQPAQRTAYEQKMSTVLIPGTKENPAVETEVPHNAGQEVRGDMSEDCITNSTMDVTNVITTNGIQAKLLNIAGQKPKEQEKPKQLPKLKQPKKPKDYSGFSPLVGPPRSGDIIAYKILELSNLYTPEVSEYKEGEVINFNHSNSMIELRLSDVAMAAEPKRDGGRFEMDSEENQTEQAEPAPVDRLVLVTLPSLIDPKLIT